MKKNINRILDDDVIRIADIYYKKIMDKQQSAAISNEINTLRSSLNSQFGILEYDDEAFNFSNTLNQLKKSEDK